MVANQPQLPAGTTADPGLFQNLMNLLGNVPDSRFARYGAGAATAVGQFAQGDIAGGLGAAAGTAVAGKLLGGLGAAVPNPVLRGALQIGGSLLGGAAGAQLGKGTAAIGGQLVGGTQAAVQDATTAIAGAQREAGTAAGTGKEAGLGGMSSQELNNMTAIAKLYGVNIPAEAMERSFQVVNKMKDRDVGRQMQMNQQLAGLTAQLQRNLGGMQLAGQAMNIGGALTGQMLTSNPYAASVLNTGVRGPMG